MRLATRLRLVTLVVAVMVAGPSLTSCADCFFDVKGHVVDCTTKTPVSGVAITVRIDQGLHGARTLPATFSTDGAGMFKVNTDGSEHCSAWATLMFRKDAYTPLDTQFQGAPRDQVEVCMTPLAAPGAAVGISTWRTHM